MKENKRKADLVAGPSDITLAGATVHIDAKLSNPWLMGELRKRGMNIAPNRVDADCYLVESLHQIGKRVHWCSILGGHVIGTQDFFLNGGLSGACISHLPAKSTQRFVWASDAFQSAYPEIYNIIRTSYCIKTGLVQSVCCASIQISV